MTTEPEQTRSQLWRYPGKWAREESFWREMTTRTLSALLAAGVIVLAGRSAGLFAEVPWSTIGKAFAAGSAWIGGAGAITGFVFAALAARANRRAEQMAEHMRDIRQTVDDILDNMAAHEDKRRQWEEQLAELERTHRAEVEQARQEYEARHRGTDGAAEGTEASSDDGQDENDGSAT